MLDYNSHTVIFLLARFGYEMVARFQGTQARFLVDLIEIAVLPLCYSVVVYSNPVHIHTHTPNTRTIFY